MKKYFAVKLIAPRTTFGQDMTPDERGIMQQHQAYWHGFMEKGFVVVFGPVLDPAGVYGLGIVGVDEVAQLEEFIKNDPANGLHKFEYSPMMAVLPEK